MATVPQFVPQPFGLTETGDAGGMDLGAYGAALQANTDAAIRNAQPLSPVINAPVHYNRGTNQYLVGNRIIEGDNETQLADSLGWLQEPGNETSVPPDSSWQQVDFGSYLDHVQQIVDPGLLRSMSRNFGIGVDNAQLLGGYLGQFVGAEGWGKGVVDQQIQDLGKTEVYNRTFTDIGGGDKDIGFGVTTESRGLTDWFVANLAQQGPNIVESAVVALIGAIGGGAAGGGPNPFTAAGGALAALAGKTEFKAAVLAAARKHAAGEALDAAEDAALRKAAGLYGAASLTQLRVGLAGTTDDLVKAQITSQIAKLSDDILGVGARTAAAGGMNQARVGGAAIATGLNNYGMGVADIYGEMLDSGVSNRAEAMALAVPYALAETVPELLLGMRFFGDVGARAGKLSEIPTRTGRAIELLKRGSTGAVVGGTLEGATEASQEALLLAANPLVSWDSAEGINRLVNSFAAGFGVGGTISGAANLRDKQRAEAVQSGEEANLLGGGNLPATVPPPFTPTSPMTGEVMPDTQGQLPAPPATQQLALPAPLTVGEVPDVATVDSQGTVRMPDELDAPVNLFAGSVMPQNQGGQGLLNVFDTGAQLTVGEMYARMFPGGAVRFTTPEELQAAVQAGDQEAIAVASEMSADPRQGALQFSTPLPSEGQAPLNTQLSDQLGPLQGRQQRQTEFDQAQQQRLSAEEQQRQIDFDAAQYELVLQDIASRQLAGEDLSEQEIALLQTPEGQAAMANAQQAPIGQAEMPMVEMQPRTPQQMSLFRGNVKMPKQPAAAEAAAKKANKLKRILDKRVAADDAAAAERPSPAEFLRAGQGVLFTQQGEPSVAALKSASVTTPVAAPVVDTTVTQAPPTGKPVNAVTSAAQRKKTAASVMRKGKTTEVVKTAPTVLKKGTPDATKKQSTTSVVATKQPNSGQQTTVTVATVPKTTGKVASKATSLKKGSTQNATDNAQKTQAPVKPKSRFDGMTPSQAWDIMRDGEFIEFTRLPKDQQEDVKEALAAGTFNAKTFQLILDTAMETVELSPREEIQQAIFNAETTRGEKFDLAIADLVYYAFFDIDENSKRRGITALAADFLTNSSNFTPEQLAAVDAVFLDSLNMEADLVAVKRGKPQDWFVFAEQRGLVPRIKNLNARVSMLPEQYTVTKERTVGSVANPRTTSTQANKDNSTPEALLETAIDRLIAGVDNAPSKTQADKLAKNLEAMFKQVTNKKYITARSVPLSSYFNEKGKLKTYKNVSGNFVPTTKTFTKDQLDQIEQDHKAYRAAVAAEAAAAYQQSKLERDREARVRNPVADKSHDKAVESQFEDDAGQIDDLSDFTYKTDSAREDGMFYRADTHAPINGAVSIGRVKLLIARFIGRFKIKPNTFVFRNIEDLKTKNPKLYAEAKAARPHDDFDTTNAVGYSFKGNVIIFTDFVRSEQQLGFVLAHESLGHFGFKGVMSRGAFENLMNQVFNSDKRVRSYVAQMQEIYGMDRMEAIEEYLADFAGVLDTSMIARVWSALKTALNKLGFKFDDDLARQMISQTRRYMRTGQGGFFSASEFAAQLESMAKDGAYAAENLSTMGQGQSYMQAQVLNRVGRENGGLFGAVNAIRDRDFNKAVNGWRGFQAQIARALEKVQTVDNMALRSEGLSKVLKYLRNQSQKAQTYLSKYNQLTAFSHKSAAQGGPALKDLLQAGEWMIHATLSRRSQVTEAMLRAQPKMVFTDDQGNFYLNTQAVEQIRRAGRVTIEDFANGLEYINSEGVKVVFRHTIDPQSKAWKAFEEQRNALDQAAIDLMLSNYEASRYEADSVFRKISSLGGSTNAQGVKNVFDDEDMVAIRKIADMYQQLADVNMKVEGKAVKRDPASTARADKFLIAATRAIYESNKVNDWLTNKAGEDVNDFQTAEFDDIKSSLAKLNKVGVTQSAVMNVVQKGIRDLMLFSTQRQDSEYSAVFSILGAYTPIARRGNYATKLTAYTLDGRVAKLSDSHLGVMPYFLSDGMATAKEIQDNLGEFYGDKTWTLEDRDGNEVQVKLVAEVSNARQTPDLADTINYNEFVYVMTRLNVSVTPQERERIMKALTDQNAKARSSLQATGNTGWDENVFRNVAEHLETVAHTAAKKLYRHRIEDTLLNGQLWQGDSDKLKSLKAAIDAAPTPQQRVLAQREYDAYALQYQYSKAQGHTVEINGKPEQTLGRGNSYLDEAHKLIRFQNERLNISDSTEELLSNEYGASMRMLAVLMQLGGSFASAAVNLVSLPTHSFNYLAFYNAKEGYGGGYGEAASSAALFKAFKQMTSTKLADAASLNEILKSKTWSKYGLTEDEATFLRDQTESGMLMAAAFDALAGTSRGKFNSNNQAAGVKAWMYMFSYTEQLNRRTTALAAYRLEKARQVAAGNSNEDATYAAQQSAETAVYTSQGDYAAYNRPEMARGNILQYVFMYKTFVILTVEMLWHLSPKGKVTFLGMMLLMSGFKGIPFADDMLDLVNTFCQLFGIKFGDVEASAIQMFDELIPGFGKYAMRGGLDTLTGATISSRVNSADILPFTGMFKAGADPWRETSNFLGPVASNIFGMAGFAANTAKYGLEVVGLRDDTMSGAQLLRSSPASAMRSIGDMLTYHDTGAITNSSGKIISRDLGVMNYVTRALGFYPAVATQNNDLIRMAETSRNYMLQVRMEYTQQYVRAGLENDRATMRDVLNNVRDWNKASRGTGLTLNNFSTTANRALKDARQPLIAKYRKYAPAGTRENMDYLMGIYGIK
jgi:hypothetical protein